MKKSMTLEEYKARFPSISARATVMTLRDYQRKAKKLLELKGAMREAGRLGIKYRDKRVLKRYDVLFNQVGLMQADLDSVLVAPPPVE